MSVQANVRAYQDKYEEVRGHCMCGRIEDDGVFFRVIYPAGDWPQGVGGVQASYGVRRGKLQALEAILDRMERDWKGSFPNAQ
jgi:hypothetical protein